MGNIEAMVNVNGVVTALARATIPVTDRGFLYGDSVYETMRTAGGNPVELPRHLQRLDRSAEGIGLKNSFAHQQIATAVTQSQFPRTA